MIEFIGWVAAALGGGYLVFVVVLLLLTGMGLGGLETLPPALFLGAVSAILWVAFILWLSPLSVVVS